MVKSAHCFCSGQDSGPSTQARSPITPVPGDVSCSSGHCKLLYTYDVQKLIKGSHTYTKTKTKRQSLAVLAIVSHTPRHWLSRGWDCGPMLLGIPGRAKLIATFLLHYRE